MSGWVGLGPGGGWGSGRRVGSLERAAAFFGDVGFALLLPSANVVAPSLWEARSGSLVPV